MPEDLSERLIDAMNDVYGSHAGHRAAHAKGVLCAATFTPTAEAPGLCTAPHFAGPEIRAHVRFSNASGKPTRPDGARDNRGMSVKFYLPDGRTTDIVGLSMPTFHVRTPQDLLAFSEAQTPDPATGKPDPAKIAAYVAEHPEALPAIQAAMSHPIPASYAALTYHSVHAYGFEDPDGVIRYGRYRLVPEDGEHAIPDEEARSLPPDYLRDELAERFDGGPAVFFLDVQLAEEDDPLDDATAPWPDHRDVVRLGRLELTGLAFDREQGDDILVMDPTRVTDGIHLTDDPILRARPGAYSVSVARRTGG